MAHCWAAPSFTEVQEVSVKLLSLTCYQKELSKVYISCSYIADVEGVGSGNCSFGMKLLTVGDAVKPASRRRRAAKPGGKIGRPRKDPRHACIRIFKV